VWSPFRPRVLCSLNPPFFGPIRGLYDSRFRGTTMATASRWVDVQFEFGNHSACLTEIFYHTLDLFHSKFGERIMRWPHNKIKKRASYYSKCVYRKGSALPNVVGFIDGTAIEIASPGRLRQRASYSGQRRRNCVKFQAVSAHEGLILHLNGPIEVRRHDMTLYRESKID
jgi:DDE superfamily endonuclease